MKSIAATVILAAGYGLFIPPTVSAQSASKEAQSRPTVGSPLQGLTPAQFVAFDAGANEFQESEAIADGLGPIFNRDSCAACHSVPTIGGSSSIMTTRFGQVANGVFDPLTSLGGSLLQVKAINPIGLEHIPQQANVTAHRQTPPLFGSGLIDAIPDQYILWGVRKIPVNGVLGRAAMVQDRATGKTLVGRFGWKAQEATLLSFAGDAYANEIGITNRLFPTENAPNGNQALLAKLLPPNVPIPNDQPDPITGKSGIDRLADFMRLLAPPQRQPMNGSTIFGEVFFFGVGCANCHSPIMLTGSSPVEALNCQIVPLYSDLLLHDMGSLGDGIAQGAAGPTEMKTPPLWGLRASGPYLHDGRAKSVDAAIRAHDGEAGPSRDQYLKLTPEQQNLLLEFLDSI